MRTFIPYILISVIALVSSCNKSEIFGEAVEENQNTQIRITIEGSDLEKINTKGYGLTPAQEQNIKTLDVLIFNSAQTLVSRSKLTDPTNLTNTISTKSGNGMSIYVVANASMIANANGSPNDVLGMVTTVNDLKNIKVTNLLVDVSTNKTLIMSGSSENVTISPTGSNSVTVPIYYMATKITVNIYSTLPLTESFEHVDWKLASLARYSYIFPRSTDAVDVNTESDFVTQLSTNTWNNRNLLIGGILFPVKTTTFYVFENRRGITSNTDARLKSGSTAPARATKMIARGYHRKLLGLAGVTGVDIHLMFGENSINDYNIERTKEYIYNINIRGLNNYDIDTRYTNSGTGFQAEVINPTLDAHYDFRPLRISAFEGASSVIILDANNNPTTGSFWLKLSQKDITKFVDNGSGTYIRPTYNPLTDMLQTTSVIHAIPTGMDSKMVYLYADEFLTEGATRTAKVIVTHTPSAGTALAPTIISITQKGILLAGNVGLRTVNASNTITTTSYVLGLEQIEEATLSITPGNLNNERTSTMQYGFNGIQLLSLDNKGLRNGYENTLMLTLSNIASATLRTPYGRAGASTISHQLYNPIYNTYAARYCFEKNRDTDGNGVISGSEIKWYLPSAEELLLIYVGNNSWTPVVADRWMPKAGYMSSTQLSNVGNIAIYFGDGLSGYNDTAAQLQNVRCVRKM